MPRSVRRVPFVLLALGLAGTHVSCDFAERTPAVLQIIAPEPNHNFRETDDTASLDGTQIDVLVEGEGEGHEIVLSRLLGGAPKRLSSGTLMDGQLLFTQVTLVAGANVLQAQDTVTGRTSLPLTVYLESPCRNFALIEPQLALGATELVLGPRDDRDGAPCGDDFSVRLIVATGLPDGSTVTLLADDLPLISGTTYGGVLDLDSVPFGDAIDSLGKTFLLYMRVADSQCPDVTLGAPVRIDCEGPTPCQIEPLGVDDVVNAEADLRPDVPGLQLPISVLTGEEARGQPVALVINDGLLEPLTAIVAAEEAPVATFEQVSLPEGDVRLDALCVDAVANQTRSARRTVYVDSLGCPIEITSPAENTSFTPDSGESTVELTLTASFDGGDCARAYVTRADSDSCSGLFVSEAEELAVGQTTISRTLTLQGEGTHALCVGIEDMNGNRQTDVVRVQLEPAPEGPGP